jgi:hypothetical protein
VSVSKDRGQVYQEVRDALFDITDQDFDTVADWKKWWEISKATFDPMKKPTGILERSRKRWSHLLYHTRCNIKSLPAAWVPKSPYP